MSYCDSYIDFNNWISQIITDAKKGKPLNLNKIIKLASRLPSPDTEEKYINLVDSGISYCIDEFVSSLYFLSKLDTSSVKKKAKKHNIKERLIYYTNELWKTWEKYFLRFGWDYYISHLIKSEKYQKRKSALEYAYHNITHQGNKCFNSPCAITEDIEELNKFQMEHFSEYLSLSRKSILGCEGFVYASAYLENVNLFKKIFKYWNSPNVSKLKLGWIPFIMGAGNLKRADILKDIWESMKLEYQEIAYYHTVCLLYSAQKAKVNEIIEYFEDLNNPSNWDLSRSHDSHLDLLLSKYSIETDIRSLSKLEYKSVEGKFWKKFIKHHFEKNIIEAENLFYELSSFLQLHEKDLIDWHSTFCLAQETYARELRSRLYIELQNQFSYLERIDQKYLLKEIETGNLSSRIKKYQEKVSQILNSTLYIPMEDEVLEYNFVPFIDCFLSNHLSFLKDRENFYKWQNNDEYKLSFFRKAEKFYNVIKTKKIYEQDWQFFLYLLLSQIKKNIDNDYSELFLAEIHSMKRIFVKKFENPLQSNKVSSTDKYELATKAIKFIWNISSHLPKYRIMEPKKFDIIPEIEKHLLKDYFETTESVFPCCLSFNIAGYDGICEDYLLPILIELRSNAEKALSYLPEEKRNYQVNMKYGKRDYSGYGILAVTNNFVKNDKNIKSDPISTGIGKKNIQYYATFFQDGGRRGWAEFNEEHRKEYNFHIVKIFFPLWEEPVKDKLNYV